MNDSPALRPGEPVGEALRAIAAETLTRARAVLDDPAREPTATVHEIRRVMKRWRALLRMLTPILGDNNVMLRHAARDLARKLSPARDAQASIDAFRDAVEPELERPILLSARSIATVQARLEALRADDERSIWNDERRREMTDYVIAAAFHVGQWNVEAVRFADVARSLATTYRRARRAIPANWDSIEPETLHELRRRVVEHRYQMELMEPAWPRLGRVWVDEAQRLRTRLGKYQDLTVLTPKTGPHQPLAYWRAKLMPMIAERQHEHALVARRIAARIFVESPNGFRRRLVALWNAQGAGGGD